MSRIRVLTPLGLCLPKSTVADFNSKVYCRTLKRDMTSASPKTGVNRYTSAQQILTFVYCPVISLLSYTVKTAWNAFFNSFNAYLCMSMLAFFVFRIIKKGKKLTQNYPATIVSVKENSFLCSYYIQQYAVQCTCSVTVYYYKPVLCIMYIHIMYHVLCAVFISLF